MELYILAGLKHQLFGKLLVCDRKFKLIGLQTARSVGAISGLNQLPLVCLENNSFVNQIIELSRFDTAAKYVVVPYVNKYGKCKYNNKTQPT